MKITKQSIQESEKTSASLLEVPCSKYSDLEKILLETPDSVSKIVSVNKDSIEVLVSDLERYPSFEIVKKYKSKKKSVTEYSLVCSKEVSNELIRLGVPGKFEESYFLPDTLTGSHGITYVIPAWAEEVIYDLSKTLNPRTWEPRSYLSRITDPDELWRRSTSEDSRIATWDSIWRDGEENYYTILGTGDVMSRLDPKYCIKSLPLDYKVSGTVWGISGKTWNDNCTSNISVKYILGRLNNKI